MKILKSAAIIVLCFLLTGCAQLASEPEKTISIYAASPHIYAMTKQLLAGVEGCRLSCLCQPSDACLRSYELTDWDLYLLVYDCDVLITNGASFESYASTLSALGESEPAVIDASYGLTLISNTASDTDEHFSGDDPRAYLSTSFGIKMLENIANALCELLSDESETIKRNLSDAKADIAVIDIDIPEDSSVIIMAEGLEYIADDFGLNISYTYPREIDSTIISSSMDELFGDLSNTGSKIIMIEKQAPQRLVSELAENGYIIVPIDLMDTSSAMDIPYSTLFKNNAEALKKAFTQ